MKNDEDILHDLKMKQSWEVKFYLENIPYQYIIHVFSEEVVFAAVSRSRDLKPGLPRLLQSKTGGIKCYNFRGKR